MLGHGDGEADPLLFKSWRSGSPFGCPGRCPRSESQDRGPSSPAPPRQRPCPPGTAWPPRHSPPSGNLVSPLGVPWGHGSPERRGSTQSPHNTKGQPSPLALRTSRRVSGRGARLKGTKSRPPRGQGQPQRRVLARMLGCWAVGGHRAGGGRGAERGAGVQPGNGVHGALGGLCVPVYPSVCVSLSLSPSLLLSLCLSSPSPPPP